MLTILHSESSTGWGGQEVRILHEALAFKEKGYNIIIVTSHGSNLEEEAHVSGIKTCVLGLRHAISPFDSLKVLSILKKEQVDIVNTHSSIDSWVVAPVAKLLGIPVIRTRHVSTRIKNSFLYNRLCDRIIVTADAIREDMIKVNRINPGKITVIPTGIDLARFNVLKVSSEKVRREFFIPNGVPVIGMVSVLRSWKGHRYFIEAASKIIKVLPYARFMIVGDGPMKDFVEDTVDKFSLQNHVIMTGFRTDIPEIMAAMDIFVLPSTGSEGIPQAILQAQALCRPVIGTNVGGIPEVIEDGVTGVLIPPRDPDTLASSILSLIHDRDRMRELGMNGRRLVKEKFSIQNMVDKIEMVYREFYDISRVRKFLENRHH